MISKDSVSLLLSYHNKVKVVGCSFFAYSNEVTHFCSLCTCVSYLERDVDSFYSSVVFVAPKNFDTRSPYIQVLWWLLVTVYHKMCFIFNVQLKETLSFQKYCKV